MLSEDLLLEIFDFYRLNAMESSFQRPWKWHRLAHVCQKWRHLLSLSPRRLDLRILCEYGAPIESFLGSWPTLPLVVRYKDLRSKSLPHNVIVALRRPHRVSEIDLVLPNSLIGSIVEAIHQPLPGLECIRVTVRNAMEPMPVREAFLGGSAPHLREIKLDGIAFPFAAIRQVLLSTNNLVELHLDNIPNAFYIPPDDLVTGLSPLVHLKRLTVGFHSPTSSPHPSMTHPLQRATLPSLASLGFRGASEYLEVLVDRIDLPGLHTITIRLFNDIFFDIPRFFQLIPDLNALASSTSVTVRHFVRSVSVSLMHGSKLSEGCLFVTSCRQLDWQLSFATQILSQLSPLLSGVGTLSIKSGHELPTGEEDVESTQWLELFELFAHVKHLDVSDELVPSVSHALVAEDMAEGVLPELTSLRLSNRTSLSTTRLAEQFVATRELSGRTVKLIG
jgi:hypothetical protein